MKKLLSLLLCLCMIMSFVPMAASAAEDSTKALEMLGFSLDPSSYDTNALRLGTNPIDPKYDLYIDSGSSHVRSNATKTHANAVLYQTVATNLNMQNAFGSEEGKRYFVSTAFAATPTGVKDHIAKLYFENDANGGDIMLSIYDSSGNRVVDGASFYTGGRVTTSDSMEMWEIEGLLSMAAGDFDGDGVDEIAIYAPDNYHETSDGSTPGDLWIGIIEYDAKAKRADTRRLIDLSAKGYQEVCEWEYSHREGKKQFYSLPYVSLCAEDFNGDGCDDLAAVVNFSTWFRWNGGGEKYTTKEILDHNTCFASVLEVYEGTDRVGDYSNIYLERAIKHKVLVTDGLTGGSSDSNTKNRFILRNASVTVGDVTAEGSKQIIIGGNYTRATVEATTNYSKKVTSNRYVEVDGNHALCHIVGYTTYDNLKKKNLYDKNTDYHWTVQRNGNDWTYWYNEDNTDSAPITESLCAYKRDGVGNPDTIFLGGQFFKYDSSSGELKFSYDYEGPGSLYNGSTNKKKETSVVWIGKAVAGNISNDMFGREEIFFPFYFKVSGKEKYNCKVLSQYQGYTTLTRDPASFSHTQYVFEDAGTQKLVSLIMMDGDNKTSYITYEGDTDVYYSDVEVLAVMQAPPLYAELNDDTYIGNSVTGFAKSTGSSEGISHGGSLTAGVVTGFEQETSFLGLFKCGGAEYELSITGTASYEHSTETTYDYSTGFETAGTTDAAVVFTVPYVRYNCTMYVPEYKLPAKADYTELGKFKKELLKNLEKYIETAEAQTSGSYVKGCKYYEYKYNSYVDEDNFQEQAAVYNKVAQEIDFIEKAIAECGKGGTGEWGGTVEDAVLPYHYSVPQQPMVTTVSVETYDAIADVTPGLDKIYGNVFHEGYCAGDPNTYAHSISDLNAVDDVLQSKQSGSSSVDGFLTNSSATTDGSVQSQTISVEKATSDTIGWGAAIENTSVANVGGAKIGFTVTAEYNGSSVKTSTEGNEYSGAVVGLPADTPADYSYSWKVVSYNAKLNGGKVPVVGYLTKISTTPPPSIAQNIEVEDVTDSSATITWEDGTRPADYYKLSRVVVIQGKEEVSEIGDNITSKDGKYSFTIENLTSANTSYYVLESYMTTGKCSVPTDKIIITTLPKNFSADIKVEGIKGNVIYRNGKALKAKATVTGNSGYDTLYRWQVNDGSGWENIAGMTTRGFRHDITPLDNGNKIRCSAIIVISEASSCVIYSDPITLYCGRSNEGYNVDWNTDENLVTITPDEGVGDAKVFIKSESGNVINKISTGSVSTEGTTIDLSDVASTDNVSLYIWDNNLKPITYPFVR